MMKTFASLMSLAVLVSVATAQSPLEKYRDLEFPAEPENFDKGWKDRVALEFEIMNSADLKSLRDALKDEDRLVRSMAARALGIREDKASADTLAELAQDDPEFAVRIRAVEAIGLLKMNLNAIEAVKKDGHGGVRWAANLAADQLKSDQDCAGQIRRAFAVGIKREEMGAAKVGQPAPDFTAQTLDGERFELSSVLGKKPIVIYFGAFDS
jgi:hypothetical protein